MNCTHAAAERVLSIASISTPHMSERVLRHCMMKKSKKKMKCGLNMTRMSILYSMYLRHRTQTLISEKLCLLFSNRTLGSKNFLDRISISINLLCQHDFKSSNPLDWLFRYDILDIVKEQFDANRKEWKFYHTVQSRFSEIKFSDNLWFSDYFSKTIFQFTT